MPKPKEGETEKEFIPRCVSFVNNEHPEWDNDKVLAICYSYWREKYGESVQLEEGSEFVVFEESADFNFEPEITITENSKEATTTNTSTKRMIAIVGDRFMNGGFFSYETVKTCYKNWEGTLHDINHMGTRRSMYADPRPDIRYFVAYHDDVQLNEETKSVSMNINVVPETMYASAWEGYITLCERAGKTPNVSVTYAGLRKFVKAKDLPVGTNYQSQGYSENDLVPYLYNVTPICVSTVLQGKCNDKQGCGILNATCPDKKDEGEVDETLEKEKQELIKWLKENE